MKQRDKLAEYIRKEVDSIPYEGADDMWKDFEKSNSNQLAKWDKSSYFFPILLALMLLFVSSIYFFQDKNNSSLATNNNTLTTNNDKLNSNNNTSKQSSEINDISSLNNEITEDNKRLKGNRLGHPMTSSISENHFSTIEKTKIPTSLSSENSKTKNNISISKKPDSQLSLIDNNVTTTSNLFPNQNVNSTNDLNTPSIPSSQLLEYQNSKESKNVSLEKLGVADELELRSKISTVEYLNSEMPFLELQDLEERLGKIDIFPRGKKKRGFFVRTMFSTSTNSPRTIDSLNFITKIYRTSLDIGKTMKFNRNSGLNYGFGFAFEDGFSVSQDSIIFVNGISIQEITNTKDLDFLISPFLNLEYFIRKNNLTASFGSQISYAAFNRVLTYERTTYIGGFGGGTSSSSGIGWTNNLWTNSVNRLGFNTNLQVSYRINNLEIGAHAFKRINKLIKKNNALSNKSNNPFLFGMSITKYFNQ